MAEKLKKIEGVTVLDHEGGTRFYHKHRSIKARRRKRTEKKRARDSRKRNRR